MTFSTELFPAPLGPMIAWISPLRTLRSTSARAVTPPKERVIPSKASISSDDCCRLRLTVGISAAEMSRGSNGIAPGSKATAPKRLMPMSAPDRGRLPGSMRRLCKDRARKHVAACLELAHERNDSFAEELDLLLEMEEAQENEIGPGRLERNDTFGNLFGRSDQIATETVIILNEIFEGGPRPVAFALR